MNGDGYQDLKFRRGEETVTLRSHPRADGSFRLELPTRSVEAEAVESDTGTFLRVDGVSHRLRVVRRGAEMTVILAGQNHVLHQIDPLAPPRVESTGDNKLTAPIPARVSRVLASRATR